jgi:3-dehydroquinate synthase
MDKKVFRFSTSSVNYFFESGMGQLKEVVDTKNSIILTDENVYAAHTKRFKNWNTIVLKPGEEFKVQETVDSIIEQLIEMGADRQTTLIGVGGGVITDLAGYVASVYMRGISFGFVPTTLLSLVDASIGGKNGIDVGIYKNMVGAIKQPSFILQDLQFLSSLPETEWQNGFAEIIKHACIKDAAMFGNLESKNLAFYKKNKKEVSNLIRRNVLLKAKVVMQDEFEIGDRKLLNFGHTLGHALENQYELSHGQAISIGMTYASDLSHKLNGFKSTERVPAVLEKYGLPTYAQFDKDKVINVLKMDKKKENNFINFILLQKIGKAVIKKISIDQLYSTLS